MSKSPSPNPSSGERAAPGGVALTTLVESVHRERLSGIAAVHLPEGVRRLHFVDGELHLTADHPLAGALEPRLAALHGDAGRGPGGSAAELRALMTRIAFLLAAWSEQGRVEFRPQIVEEELVGPLPTVLILMEWAAAGDEETLLAALGGDEAEVSAAGRRSDAARLAARLLDPHAAVLLSRLARPVSIDDLLRQSATGPTQVLADLARLRAAGLVSTEGGGAPAAEEAPVRGIAPQPVAPDVLQRFAERVGRELASRPLVLDADSHRSRLADLLSRAGGLTAYELLDVGGSAGDQEIHEAYQRLARLAHPRHAERLDLAGGDRPLWLLFEQVTAAYLTLSQPERRRRYDRRLAAVGAGGRRATPAHRGGEVKSLARSYYERAEALIDAEDFHFAIELLKQAVHTHPRPEYYVLLGRVQAKNPNWLRHAMDSYRKAMDLGAEDPRISIALGRLCEEMENYGEARRHYQSALSHNPAEPDARAGLARLAARERGEDGEGEGEGGAKRWGLGWLFGRGR